MCNHAGSCGTTEVTIPVPSYMAIDKIAKEMSEEFGDMPKVIKMRPDAYDALRKECSEDMTGRGMYIPVTVNIPTIFGMEIIVDEDLDVPWKLEFRKEEKID